MTILLDPPAYVSTGSLTASGSSTASQLRGALGALSGASTVATWLVPPAAQQFRVRREDILKAAASRLSALSLKDVAPVAIENAFHSIFALTRDDSPTPQIGLDGDGGVETEWLVDGHSLVLNNLADGTNVLWSLDPAGDLRFRDTFNVKWMVGEDVVRLAGQLLDDLSSGVRNRLSSSILP